MKTMIKKNVFFYLFTVFMFFFVPGCFKADVKDKELSTKSVVLNITKQDSLDQQIKNGKPTILKFYANWCGPCRQFSPIFEKIATKFVGKYNFIEVNVDEGKEIAKKFGIMGIPVIFMFDSSGKQIEKQAGILNEKELEEKIIKKLKK